MRIPALASLIGVAMIGVAASANAESVTYSLTGTVTQATPANVYGPPHAFVGEQVPILITVDPTYTPYPGTYGNAPLGATAYVNPQTPSPGVLALSVTINGQPLGGLFEGIYVIANSLIEFAAGSPLTNSGGFDIVLSGALPGALPTDAIPLSLDASDFQFGTFTVTEVFSPTVAGFSGTINGLADVPTAVAEPGTGMILAAGLLGLLVARRRSATS